MYNKIGKVAPVKLSIESIEKSLVRNWRAEQDHIVRTYKFKNFEDTWGFLTKVAMRSHLMGHHPTLTNTYNEVKVALSTHDVGGISDVDMKMADRFERYFEDYRKQ